MKHPKTPNPLPNFSLHPLNRFWQNDNLFQCNKKKFVKLEAKKLEKSIKRPKKLPKTYLFVHLCKLMAAVSSGGVEKLKQKKKLHE